jgi:thioredoxin reductase (NADPH)
MKQPVILVVDDLPADLSAIARDLRREYGAQYRIVRADAGASALEALRQLKLRDEPVALLVVDQRMPEMTGVEFLTAAIQLYPDAKRVLLTAYADTDAAIRAINDVRLDHYLMKPWDPPEERLYPVLTDLLDDWQASAPHPFEGVRVIGYRWSAHTHRIKDFLARNLVPYRWLDVESDPEARRLAGLVDPAGPGAPQLPLVLFPDGTQLAQPANVALAERLGLRTQASGPFYDLIIVGAGPAGLAAAVYGASEGLRTLLVEREAPGGQAGMSASIENYLGFPVGLSGGDLARRAVAQARRFGVEILTPQEAAGIRVQDSYRFVTLTDGSELCCQALLIATGVSYRKLNVPGADRLSGAGVYYGAAITEALASRDEDVYVVGGGNSAGQAAIYLARYARSVTILVRGESLADSMSQYLIAEIEALERITVRTRCQVVAVQGDTVLETITLAHAGGETETVPAFALFVFIGQLPRTDWLAGVVERDPQGFILTGSDVLASGEPRRMWTLQRPPFWLESSVAGIFVAGDVRHGSIKRLASAVGEGAMAIALIHQYLADL